MTQPENHSTRERQRDDATYVASLLEEVAHLLPEQGPIKDFVHHNTLHAFQHQPFHQAIGDASAIFGSRRYMTNMYYRRAFQNGRISESGLKLALKLNLPLESDRHHAERDITSFFSGKHSEGTIIGLPPNHGPRSSVLSQLVYPLLFRLTANFLDQGIAIWPMPGRHGRFWEMVSRIAKGTFMPLPPLTDKSCRRFWSMEPSAVVAELLAREVPQSEDWRDFLTRLCLDHPGWSGMVKMIEHRPDLLSHRRQIALVEFVAVELVLRYGWIKRSPALANALSSAVSKAAARGGAEALRERIVHEALEWSYYGELLKLLGSKKPAESRPMKAQAFFCIDDREGSLRRHFEALSPTTQTFGAPGFFGIDFMFQAADQAIPTQHCPVILTPKHLIREAGGKASRGKRLLAGFHLWESANSGVRGWMATPVFGVWAMMRLAVHVVWGRPSRATVTGRGQSLLPVLRQDDKQDAEGRFIGYALPEMADRVGGILRNCGLIKNFASLIVMVAHGASSNNNPHFAAYDCGACAGKHGWPNARAFVTMANRPDVRVILRERGIDIPDTTHFLAAMHDTTSDDITYYDEQSIPASHRDEVTNFKDTMERALDLNARERVLKFDLAPSNPSLARSHVRQRSTALFEPRPEWNHAGNAAAIVGRRDMTLGLSLQRRVFLQSYDPHGDPSGDILAGILGAVVPVCGGINLEYWFSRVDNEVYGAGSKLPHNVIGLLGVAAGVAGDLRTGLPSQMVDIHDPVRLLVIVEQAEHIASYAIQKNPAIFEWIKNDWVKFVAIDPVSRKCGIWHEGRFVHVDPLTMTCDI